MNHEDIKRILAACPPGITASDDAEIAAALAAAEADDSLCRFREEEAAFDKAFSAKLKSISPPAHLQQQILAAAAAATKITASHAETATGAPRADVVCSTASTSLQQASAEAPLNENAQDKLVEFPWWRNPAVWSIAACFVVLFAISTLLPRQQNPELSHAVAEYKHSGNDLDGLVALAVQHSANIGSLDYRSRDYAKIANFLQQKNQPLPILGEGLQQRFGSMSSIGCATMEYKDGSVSMICFEGDDVVYHLFVTDRNRLSECSDCPKPEVRAIADRKAATWTTDSHAYVLTTGDAREDPLQPLL